MFYRTVFLYHLCRHNLRDQARECGGLGGLVNSFRAITLAMDICRDMEQLCPSAMLLEVTTAGLNHFAWFVEIRDRETQADLYVEVVDRVQSGQAANWP